ncbi:MAG TPA: CDP-archaeol synthase [Methylomirabilota bacterium]|nr:CDP-archaeol synthase [Methylomirabilota bacterium]
MHPLIDFQLLLLIALANVAPLIGKRILGGSLAHPLDGGRAFFDGRPLFGASKTVRGILLAVLLASVAAPLVGLPAAIGARVAGAAMAGDLLSSFVKRRLGLPPSSKATGLDQIPESLLPLLACRSPLSLTIADIAAVVAVFFVGEVVLSRLFYRLGLRDRPY